MNISNNKYKSLLILAGLYASNVGAVGTGPGGIDVLHVPMSWCIVDQSPAEANPNIAGDTSTDALIWRRHERPTNDIYTPQAGISLRSTINSIWGSWSFPIISDPDTSTVCGTFECVDESDVRGEDVNNSAINAEFNSLINACRTEYAAIGKAGIGITAINLGLYHDGDPEYVGVIGWGGCAENASGNCATPYDALIAVVDNKYLHPSSPNRTFPGNNDKTGWAFTDTDPLDQLVAHEVGHALSLGHRTNSTALMNPTQQDNDSDGQTDNIGLNATEVATLRANAMNVPGLEIDPPNQFLPGRYRAMIVPDLEPRNQKLPRHLDLAAMRATWDTKNKNGTLETALNGLIPLEANFEVLWLLDQDNNSKTGAQAEDLKEITVPGDPGIAGVEFVAEVTVHEGIKLTHRAWRWNGDQLVEDSRLIRPELLTMRLHSHIAPIALRSDEPVIPKLPRPAELYHIVRVLGAGPVPDRTFVAQALIARNNEQTDRLTDEVPAPFELTNPVFPHCFPDPIEVQRGEIAKVTYDGLGPFEGKPLHALLGATLITKDIVGPNGEGTVEMPIPSTTPEGPHLVTIGPDGAALTADCTITVVDRFKCNGDFDQDGDVDGSDLQKFSKDFGRDDCPIPGVQDQFLDEVE